MKRVLFALAVFVTVGFPAHAAEPPADQLMGVYEGFWKTSDGARGRITAQIRTVSGGKHDGFVAFYKSKVLEGVLKLRVGDAKFDGDKVTSAGGMLAPEVSGSAQIENSKLTGSFKGDMGEGTFEAAIAHPKSRSLGARPPKRAKVLFDGKPTPDAWTDFHWKVTPEGTMIVQNGDI